MYIVLVTFLHYCSTIIEKKNNQLIQIKEEQKGVLNFHETKERPRVKKPIITRSMDRKKNLQ